MLAPGRNRRLLPLVIVSAVALLMLDAAGFGPIRTARRTVLSVGHPIGAMFSALSAPVTNTWDGAVHYDDVVDENRELRRRLAELEGAAASLPDVEADLKALLDATEIPYLLDVATVTARVDADRRSDVQRVIEIDKGSEAGIGHGMPVVTGHGLVGTVELVTGNRSVVRLITDAEVAVGVRSPFGLALVTGRPQGLLELQATSELIESIEAGTVGDEQRFVTSGVDRSIYPPGIPVGTLVIEGGRPMESDPIPGSQVAAPGVTPDPAGPARRVDTEARLLLRPLADMENLGYVTVLLVEPPS